MALHGVFYTDGSAKPLYQNNYKIGWGIHGYLYNDYASKPINANDCVITDKGYIKKSNYQESGFKAIEPIEYIDAFGSYPETSTNNVAELSAVINALSKARELKLNTILIYTDSEYVKKGITEWLPGWVANDWIKQDGKPVANSKVWSLLYNLINAIKDDGIEFEIDWIKAHNGNQGNVQADLLASIACNYSFMGEHVTRFDHSEPNKYWKYEVGKHPLINFNRVYFNSLEQYNTSGHYYQADPGGNDYIIGKRLPQTGYSVLRLNNPDTVIEAVKAKQYHISRSMNAIFMIKMDNTHNKLIHQYINAYQQYAIHRFRKNNNLVFIDDFNTPLTVEINPTGLSLRAIDSFNFLEELLDIALDVRANPEASNDLFKLQFTDITEIFYDLSGKAPALKGEYTVGYSNMTLPIVRDSVSYNIPYILGTDCPARNNLKRLETLNPKLTLVTYTESENTFRYATIIECDDAIGIWSNFYADKIYI